MFKKYSEKSLVLPMDTTSTTTNTTSISTTTNTLKSKKFPAMFKKMMLSRLKNISKDATSAVKSSVQRKSSAKKKSTVAAPVETAAAGQEAPGCCESVRPGTATLDKPLTTNCKRTAGTGNGPETRPSTACRRLTAKQQFNNRTYRVKTKDRKSVLSLPEVSKQIAATRVRKSHLPVKVKPLAPAPPVRQHLRDVKENVAPDAKSPEAKSLDAKSPEAKSLEAKSLEVKSLEAKSPKAKSPEAKSPEAKSPEVKSPEAKSPEAKSPEAYRPEEWVPTAVGSARKKRLVLCYLCGKEFGTASLPFHEPQCLKKWTQENSRLPEHLQRITPQKPEHQNVSVDDWNRLAWEATQSNLVPCDYCQRKFLANRLEAHARVCIESKKKTVTAPPTRVSKSTGKPTMQETPKKKPAPCYVCGRLFGTASIGIHEPQCLIKWARENDSLAPHLRRPAPTRPEVIVDRVTGKVDHQATREEHWKSYLSQLVPCDRCKRTFDPNRLEVHQRSCKGLTSKT